MYENELNLGEKERKFNYFLNQTIIGSLNNYYKLQKKIKERELCVIDDENYDATKIVSYECNYEDLFESKLDTICSDKNMCLAIKSLSYLEKMVIFLYIVEGIDGEKVADYLKITQNSVYRINKRAINKIKKYLAKVGNDYE